MDAPVMKGGRLRVPRRQPARWNFRPPRPRANSRAGAPHVVHVDASVADPLTSRCRFPWESATAAGARSVVPPPATGDHGDHVGTGRRPRDKATGLKLRPLNQEALRRPPARDTAGSQKAVLRTV